MQVHVEYQQRLAEQIGRTYPLSLRVFGAFARVPRHLFVPAYYEQRELRSAPVPESPAFDAWLSRIYEDRALTIQQDERGRPLSSSSQPSIMALMLDALDVRPGMRVLEIGTGTGYNAALLAHLTGDPARVTTIDLDPTLTERARARIAEVVGAGMTVLSGDGRLGVPEHAPYERLIATASAFPVPPAWIAQLAPDGKLVLDLRGKIGGGLMVATKRSAELTTGRFLEIKEPVCFLGLRDADVGTARAEVVEMPLWEEQTLYEPGTMEYAGAEHFLTYEQFRGSDDTLNLWVQCLFPSLSIKWMQKERRVFALLWEGESRTTLVIERRGEQIGVAVKGTRPLWSELAQAYQEWLALERLGYEQYGWMMTAQGQTMQVAGMGMTREVVLTGT